VRLPPPLLRLAMVQLAPRLLEQVERTVWDGG
jgi:hypothetical protein